MGTRKKRNTLRRQDGRFLPSGKPVQRPRKYVPTGRPPGRPRKDGLPPIPRKVIAAAAADPDSDLADPITGEVPVVDPTQPVSSPSEMGGAAVKAAVLGSKVIARIRYLAGRRQTPDDIAALIEHEFPALPPIPPEAFKLGGMYYKHVRIGRALVNLKVGETLVTKATEGKYVETMFWAKSEMGMAETAAGRAKVAQEQRDDDIGEIEFTFADPLEPEQATPTPIDKARRKKRVA